METLVDRANHLTMAHFGYSAKQFIERGLGKGRHYFYLRDALGLTDRKFNKLMLLLNIDIPKVTATKKDFYDLFKEVEIIETVSRDA